MVSPRSATAGGARPTGGRRPPGGSGPSSRLWVPTRWAAVLALVAGLLLSAAPVAAQDQELDGDTFTDEEFGWSVQFDDDVWEAEVAEGSISAGLSLNTDGFVVVASLFAEPNYADPEECLDGLEDVFRGGSEWDDFAPTTDYDEPETDADANGGVYAAVLTGDDGTELDIVLYLECRQLEEGSLSVAVSTVDDDFEDSIPIIEDLLAGIEIAGADVGPDDGPSPDGPVTREDPTPEDEETEEPEETPDPDDETPAAETPDADLAADHDPDQALGARDDAELDDGAYVSEVGYGLTWDPELYEGETPEDPGTGVLLTNPETGATVELAAFEDPSIEDCIDAEVTRVLSDEAYRSAAESDGIRPPDSDDEAAGRVLRATEDTTQRQRKILYVECRPLAEEGEGGDPVFLVVRGVSDDEDFRASRAQLEVILAAITVGDEPPAAPTATEEPEDEPTSRPTRQPTDEPDDEPTPRPRRTPTPEADADLGETDIAGGVFVGEAFPFRIEWDPAVYAVEDISGQGVEGISFQSELGSFGRIFALQTGGGLTEAQCIESLVASWTETTPDLAAFTPPAGQEITWPEGAGFVYGIGTLTLDDGRQAGLISVGGCLELAGGQGFLVMQMQTFDGLYAENAAAFSDVVGAIEVGEGSGQVGVRLVGRAIHPPVSGMAAALASNRRLPA